LGEDGPHASRFLAISQAGICDGAEGGIFVRIADDVGLAQVALELLKVLESIFW
jgi:hypothetical protein